jgi:hypothetical protein
LWHMVELLILEIQGSVIQIGSIIFVSIINLGVEEGESIHSSCRPG